MQTSSLNSKKCSAPSLLAIAALLVSFVSSGAALANPGPGVTPLSTQTLLSQIQARHGGNFDTLFKQWEKTYGTDAVKPLLGIAGDKHKEDPVRYVALMGVAKIGGIETAPLLSPLLKDKSWMIRSGALRALSALGNEKAAESILPLLRDPALVVRVEAVEAVEKLHPTGSAEALMGVLESSANYRNGRAQWVPGRALAALSSLNAKDVAPRLKPLLDHKSDPELQKQTIKTLESLTGKVVEPGLSLAEQIKGWKQALGTTKKD